MRNPQGVKMGINGWDSELATCYVSLSLLILWARQCHNSWESAAGRFKVKWKNQISRLADPQWHSTADVQRVAPSCYFSLISTNHQPISRHWLSLSNVIHNFFPTTTSCLWGLKKKTHSQALNVTSISTREALFYCCSENKIWSVTGLIESMMSFYCGMCLEFTEASKTFPRSC